MALATETRPRIIAALTAYASRFHAGNAHQACSPLGAWMLLAIMSPLTNGATRAELEQTLGCSADEAREFVAELLANPHPIVNAVAAAWLDSRAECAAIAAWRKTLASAIQTGKIPTQATADAWADKHTRGAIKQFPLEITSLTVLLVASALATKAKWDEPYSTADVSQLGVTAWRRDGREVREGHEVPEVRDELERRDRIEPTVVLHAPRDGREVAESGKVVFAQAPGAQVIASTEAAGDVGVLISSSPEGLLVVSVIAAPSVATATAMRAAHEVVALAAGQPSPAKFRSLYELPLGKGHAWSITERHEKEPAPAADREHAQVFIPAWRTPAKTNDLLAPPTRGFEPLIEALRQCLPPIPAGYKFGAAQTAVAEFNQFGFSAAAVSALDAEPRCARGGWALPLMQTIRVRQAIVRFARPFAVVAVAQATQYPNPNKSWIQILPNPFKGKAWHGIPIFSAWVTEPCEVEEEPWP